MLLRDVSLALLPFLLILSLLSLLFVLRLKLAAAFALVALVAQRVGGAAAESGGLLGRAVSLPRARRRSTAAAAAPPPALVSVAGQQREPPPLFRHSSAAPRCCQADVAPHVPQAKVALADGPMHQRGGAGARLAARA